MYKRNDENRWRYSENISCLLSCLFYLTWTWIALYFENSSFISILWASPVAQLVKSLPAMQKAWVQSLGWEDSPGEGKGCPLQYSGLENSMDCIVHGVTKSCTQLSDFHFHCLYLINPAYLQVVFYLFLYLWWSWLIQCLSEPNIFNHVGPQNCFLCLWNTLIIYFYHLTLKVRVEWKMWGLLGLKHMSILMLRRQLRLRKTWLLSEKHYLPQGSLLSALDVGCKYSPYPGSIFRSLQCQLSYRGLHGITDWLLPWPNTAFFTWLPGVYLESTLYWTS